MSNIMIKTLAGAAMTTLLTFTTPLAASNDFPAPSGEVILTISGDLDVENEGNSLVLDLQMIKELGQTKFVTSTIWTDGPTEFTGVSVGKLLNHMGVKSGTLKAAAINDYAIEIPVEETLSDPAIIAYEMNGEPMSIRDKGPLWIVYPYDSDDKYQSETYYSRSIWQLDRIEVLP